MFDLIDKCVNNHPKQYVNHNSLNTPSHPSIFSQLFLQINPPSGTIRRGMPTLIEDNQPPNSVTSLRLHHALCSLFFEGKGYSQAFIENITAFLAQPNQLVQLTTGCDTLCQACPHNRDGICDDEAKVSLFDQRTLNLTGTDFETDQPIPLHDLCQRACVAILQQGLLAEVCGECEWAALCQEKWQQGDFNRQLLPSNSADSHSF